MNRYPYKFTLEGLGTFEASVMNDFLHEGFAIIGMEPPECTGEIGELLAWAMDPGSPDRAMSVSVLMDGEWVKSRMVPVKPIMVEWPIPSKLLLKLQIMEG